MPCLSPSILERPPAAIRPVAAGGITPSFDTLRHIAVALGMELVLELRARGVAA